MNFGMNDSPQYKLIWVFEEFRVNFEDLNKKDLVTLGVENNEMFNIRHDDENSFVNWCKQAEPKIQGFIDLENEAFHKAKDKALIWKKKVTNTSKKRKRFKGILSKPTKMLKYLQTTFSLQYYINSETKSKRIWAKMLNLMKNGTLSTNYLREHHFSLKKKQNKQMIKDFAIPQNISCLAILHKKNVVMFYSFYTQKWEEESLYFPTHEKSIRLLYQPNSGKNLCVCGKKGATIWQKIYDYEMTNRINQNFEENRFVEDKNKRNEWATLKTIKGCFTDMSWSNNGQFIAFITLYDHVIQIYDFFSDQTTPIKQLFSTFRSCIWSPLDSYLLCSTNDKDFRIYETYSFWNEKWNQLERPLQCFFWSKNEKNLFFTLENSTLMYVANADPEKIINYEYNQYKNPFFDFSKFVFDLNPGMPGNWVIESLSASEKGKYLGVLYHNISFTKVDLPGPSFEENSKYLIGLFMTSLSRDPADISIIPMGFVNNYEFIYPKMIKFTYDQYSKKNFLTIVREKWLIDGSSGRMRELVWSTV